LEESLSRRLEFSESRLYFLPEKSSTFEFLRNYSSYRMLLVSRLMHSMPPGLDICGGLLRPSAGLQRVTDAIFDFADLNIVVPALVQFIAVFCQQGCEPVLHFLQQLLVFLVHVEHEVLEGGADLLFLTGALDADLLQALPQDFLLALLLD